MVSEASNAAAGRLGLALAGLPEVRLAYLFGSRALGREREDSDFDVAVLLEAEAAREDRGPMIRRLASRLGREVASDRLDLVILNGAPALLRHRVLRDGIVLLERSAEERVRFAMRAIRDYQDGFVRRRLFTERRIARLRGGRAADGGPGDLLEKARWAARLLGKAEGVP